MIQAPDRTDAGWAAKFTAMSVSRRISQFLVLFATVALAAGTLTPAADAAGGGKKNKPPKRRGMVYTASDQDFEATWAAITGAIEANANLKLIDTVDHAAAAAGIDQSLAPNRVAFFGNPNVGTPLMQVNQVAGIDLPQKLHVIERRGKVFVGFNDATYLAARHDLDGQPSLDVIAGALRNLTAAATGPDAKSRTKNANKFRKKPRLITVQSNADVDTTYQRLLGAIEGSPANVFFELDHQANAASVDLELRPTRLVVFGNPAIGTPLMQDNPTAGIDLPLKILVWEDQDGQVQVTTNNVKLFKTKHRVRDTDLSGIANALNNFLGAAAGQ